MTIPACLILDDFPINGSYWAREQQTAFGFTPTSGGLFGLNWREQGKAPFCPVEILEGFADLVEEFGLRGKFTVLPCPAGLGRIDQRVRAFPPGYIETVLDIVRRRIVPRFDITPEVLTHTMAFDFGRGALLPQVESPWVSHLAATGRHEELAAYLTHAWTVLNNVGLHPAGTTVGGLPDLSNLCGGQTLVTGHHRDKFVPVLFDVVRRFAPQSKAAFMYAFGRPTRPPYETSWLPEPIAPAAIPGIAPGGPGSTIYELLCPITEDPLLNVFHGQGDPIALADEMISADLSTGALVQCVAAGQPVVMTVHAQTLTSLNTGLGLKMLREIIRRLHERYGREMQWMTALEMCTRSEQSVAAG